MHKKLIMACMAIAAFAAFVVAPAASGAVLTENGVAISTHSSAKTCAEEPKVAGCITGKNIGNTVFTAGELTVTCTTADIPGTLTTNSGGAVAGEIAAGAPSFAGTGTSGDCTSPLGSVKPTVNSKLCLSIPKGTDNGSITGCAGASVTFTLTVTGVVTCSYSVASISGTITTSPADADVNLSNAGPALREGFNPLCPEKGTLDMEFELSTEAGGTLVFS
jgi:hypothetical protein